MMSRLRAALTPQAIALLLALTAFFMLYSRAQDSEMTQLEARAASALSSVSGAGEVKVVIRTRAASAQASSVLARQEPQQIPCGAVAVAKGADDPFVCAQITQALCALLGLPASAVSVIGGN